MSILWRPKYLLWQAKPTALWGGRDRNSKSQAKSIPRLEKQNLSAWSPTPMAIKPPQLFQQASHLGMLSYVGTSQIKLSGIDCWVNIPRLSYPILLSQRQCWNLEHFRVLLLMTILTLAIIQNKCFVCGCVCVWGRTTSPAAFYANVSLSALLAFLMISFDRKGSICFVQL